MNKITLPEGHNWIMVDAGSSGVNCFECKGCLASFTHDMTDNSQNFVDGDGTCSGDAALCPNCGSGLFNEDNDCQKCGL